MQDALEFDAIPAPRAACGALPRLHSADALRQAVRARSVPDSAMLDRVLRRDAARGVVEVQAGTRWPALAEFLRDLADLAPFAADSALGETVGASLEANAPGPDGVPLVAHVASLALVTPDGELRRASPLVNPELFALAAGGHGAVAALYSVTLKIDSLARSALAGRSSKACEPPACPGQRPLALLAPESQLAALLGEVRALAAEWRVPIEETETRSIVPEEQSYLRWARAHCALLRVWLRARRALGPWVRTTQLRRAMIDAAIARGGGYWIACTPEASREQAQACYPMLRGFLAEKRRLDPAERLHNAWYRHHRSLLAREACEVRWAN
jgi:hypothetical protein